MASVWPFSNSRSALLPLLSLLMFTCSNKAMTISPILLPGEIPVAVTTSAMMAQQEQQTSMMPIAIPAGAPPPAAPPPVNLMQGGTYRTSMMPILVPSGQVVTQTPLATTTLQTPLATATTLTTTTLTTITLQTVVRVTLQPGPVGMTFNDTTGLVHTVLMSSQAQRAGIAPGMVMLKIDGQPFSKQLLLSRVSGYAAYLVILRKASSASTMTSMKTPCLAGATKMEVQDQRLFHIGETITIDAGGPTEEDNVVVGFGSLLLKQPLQYNHGQGTSIGQATRSSKTRSSKFDQRAADLRRNMFQALGIVLMVLVVIRALTSLLSHFSYISDHPRAEKQWSLLKPIVNRDEKPEMPYQPAPPSPEIAQVLSQRWNNPSEFLQWRFDAQVCLCKVAERTQMIGLTNWSLAAILLVVSLWFSTCNSQMPTPVWVIMPVVMVAINAIVERQNLRDLMIFCDGEYCRFFGQDVIYAYKAGPITGHHYALRGIGLLAVINLMTDNMQAGQILACETTDPYFLEMYGNAWKVIPFMEDVVHKLGLSTPFAIMICLIFVVQYLPGAGQATAPAMMPISVVRNLQDRAAEASVGVASPYQSQMSAAYAIMAEFYMDLETSALILCKTSRWAGAFSQARFCRILAVNAGLHGENSKSATASDQVTTAETLEREKEARDREVMNSIWSVALPQNVLSLNITVTFFALHRSSDTFAVVKMTVGIVLSYWSSIWYLIQAILVTRHPDENYELLGPLRKFLSRLPFGYFCAVLILALLFIPTVRLIGTAHCASRFFAILTWQCLNKDSFWGP